jgi:hypothetical protein
MAERNSFSQVGGCTLRPGEGGAFTVLNTSAAAALQADRAWATRAAAPAAKAPMYFQVSARGLLAQVGQGGRPAPLACQFLRILTRFPMVSHVI